MSPFGSCHGPVSQWLMAGTAGVKYATASRSTKLVERVVKIDPAISLGHLDLGIVYAEANREEDAVREFKAAAELKPDDVNVHMRLGRLYRSMGASSTS